MMIKNRKAGYNDSICKKFFCNISVWDYFKRSINDLLLTISSIYSFSQMNYKKLIFVELISVILFMLYILFTGDSIIIKELDWFHIGFYFLVSLLLLPDSIEIMKLNKEKEKLEEEQDE